MEDLLKISYLVQITHVPCIQALNQDKFKKYRGIKVLLLLKPWIYAGGCHDAVILDFVRSITFKIKKNKKL